MSQSLSKVNQQDGIAAIHQQAWSMSPTSPTTGAIGHSTETSPLNSEEYSSLACAVDPIDGMGAVAEQEDQAHFHGPSSNVPFSRCIVQMVARVNSLQDPWITPFKLVDRSRHQTNTTTLNCDVTSSRVLKMQAQDKDMQDKYIFPSDTRAQTLLNIYFSDVAALFPYIHQATFIQNYSQLKNHGPRQCSIIWLGLFNMVLAVATNSMNRSGSPNNEWAIEAQTYYKRAVSLCDRYTIGGSTLENVQYLVVMTQYLQATQKSVQTSVVHGLAVNAAVRLGLHSPQASQKFAPLEKEMRKRTWFMCVIFDRVISMTLGQPLMIPTSHVVLDVPARITPPDTLEAPNDDNYLGLGVFKATIDLYQILGRIIEQQYGQNLGLEHPPSIVDVVSPIPAIDNELREWSDALLPDLRTISSKELIVLLSASERKDVPAVANRFRTVLTLRSLNVRVLLYRPVLVKYIEMSHTTSEDQAQNLLLGRLGSHSISMCFNSAMEIITIVNMLARCSDGAKRWLNAWWFTLYYTFNAALVVFGVMLVCQDIRYTIPNAPSKKYCKEGLQKAVQALEQLDPGNNIIARCTNYLQRLIVATNTLSPNAEDSILSETDTLPLSGSGELCPLSGTSLSGAFLGGYPMLDNVENLMTDGDLDFLDFYFPPPVNMSSTSRTTL